MTIKKDDSAAETNAMAEEEPDIEVQADGPVAVDSESEEKAATDPAGKHASEMDVDDLEKGDTKPAAATKADADTSGEKEKHQSAVSTLKPSTEGANQAFPDIFLCPITRKLMADPVVAPDGITYERTAIAERDELPDSKLYPNKALRNFMESRINTSGKSLRATLNRYKNNLQSNYSQLVLKSAIPGGDDRVLPQSLYCPISLNLMHVPVIDKDGNTYEKAAIVQWIIANGNSPLTRTALHEDDLYENHAVEEILDQEKQHSDDSLHPSIRRWQQEEPPKVPERGETVTTTESPYPTTQEQMDARRARANAECTSIGLFLAFLAILLFVPYGSVILAIILIIACCLPGRRRS
eukprot:CAMPEP_0119561900 /NCGR_PEP_ID=MMETSP1352-20130426/18969_1 /TAXON_ID=265584 /ORGANISM="Stauroneis constricta, Strain CCMP1120" /LENGTH=352 /DNA_ID=CAMNT_0007610209 /DNA_START=137 /DNA_END=1195 /DNA_ORIENTATION=+